MSASVKRVNNGDRILEESVRLFNTAGVAASSTNHICQSLKVSPGNLYFHFKNKEEIVRTLFERMCAETYDLWTKEFSHSNFLPPLEFIESSLEIFWRYRFFHREMYHLRREDPKLNQLWHAHLNRTRHFMRAAHKKWVKSGLMIPLRDRTTVRVICDVVLVTASSFFQFYESAEKPAKEKPLQLAKQYMACFLEPYLKPGTPGAAGAPRT